MRYYEDSIFPKYLQNNSYYANKNKLFVFIDISGFTPLCDEFIHNSEYGAEKIGDLLNNIFSPIIDLIYERNGDVISFAGDAMFVCIEKNDIAYIKKRVEKSVKEYSKKINRFLSVKIEILKGKYYPYIIKGKTKQHFTYYPYKNLKTQTLQKEHIYPKEVFKIADSVFKGELRSIPVFFLHIDKNISFDQINILLQKIIDISSDYSVYVNKIEYLDKGWMILVSSGLPVYSLNAQYNMLDFLYKIIKVAKRQTIPIKIGGTLQKGYAGIIGNEKRWEYTFIGSNVNLAARIAVKGIDYTILTEEGFYKTVKEKTECDFWQKVEYKGIEGKTDIYKIGKYKDKSDKNVFVGRKEEVEKGLKFINKKNKALIVYGKSGIGKTEFVKRVISLSGKKHIVLKGVQGNITPFYLFEPFIKRFNAASAKKDGRDLIQNIFRSIKEPFIIFIDDASYADEQSTEIIKWMLSEGNDFVNIVITAFTDKDVEKILPPFSEYDILKLSLPNLSIENIKDLFLEYVGNKVNKKIVKNIYQITKGNPLFIVYLIKFMGKNIMEEKDIPYSLQELILIRVNRLPYNGGEFVEGGAVFGDIFNALIVADALQFDKKAIEKIIDYANKYGMLYMMDNMDVVVFANAIVRETIYEKMLEKQINYIRIKLAEIIYSNKKYKKAIKIAAQLFYLANDKRCLPLFEILINEEKNNYEYQRSYYIKYFRFIIKNKLFEYHTLLDMLKKALDLPSFYFSGELVSILYDIAVKIKKWEKEEKLILHIALSISSFLMDRKKAKRLMNLYKKYKGKDKYYKWYYNVIFKYEINQKEGIKTYKELEGEFKGEEAISFYLNYLGYAFFVVGNTKMEKRALQKLKALHKYMTDNQKAEYYQLLNSLSMHRDNIEQSIKYLNKLKKMKLDNKYYKFLVYNDLSIIYTQIGIKKMDKKVLRLSDIYIRKAYKFVKDSGMKSHMPLITTNLASSYSARGDVKNALKYYYEGLLYGLDINHPIEVPYTKSRIARFAYGMGLKILPKNIASEIVENGYVTDLLPVSYAILYNIEGKEEYYKKGLSIAKEMLKGGIGKCIGEITAMLFLGGIFEDKKGLLRKSYNLMKKYESKVSKRSIQKINDDIAIELLEIILKDKSTKDLKRRLKYAEKINRLFMMKAISYYVLALREENYKKKEIYFVESYKIAIREKFYKIIDKLIDYQKEMGFNLINKGTITRIKNQEKVLYNIKTIEELYKYFNE